MMGGRERFLRAARRKPVDVTPIWVMRQAGRVFPQYRALRESYGLLDIVKNPELCTQVTLMPVGELDVDAAILFADIMLPLEPMGVNYGFKKGVGPVLAAPVRTEEAIDRLADTGVATELNYVTDAIKLIRHELHGDRALVGFAGGPFTLACYMIEGRPSRNFAHARVLMYREPALWRQLMSKLARVVADYLVAQVQAGVDAVQLFDSWVGGLSPRDYREYVLPYSREVLGAVDALGIPTIHFGTTTATILHDMADAGGSVIGVDWRLPIDQAWKVIGPDRAIQGNLDPAVLLGPTGLIDERVRDILARVNGRAGHVFNLGHGILPQTPLDHFKHLVEAVHEFSLAEPAKLQREAV